MEQGAGRVGGPEGIARPGAAGFESPNGFDGLVAGGVQARQLGVGPLALARAQRAQTARILIETTGLGMAEIAFAAGFGSVRQFNDTVREVYATAPSQLRVARGPRTATGSAASSRVLMVGASAVTS